MCSRGSWVSREATDEMIELQIDGLVGMTHHYGGHATGNVAAAENAGQSSHPQAAALEGLKKMNLVRRCGVKQWVLPPLTRPKCFEEDMRKPWLWFRDLFEREPKRAMALSSSAFIWTANMATVCPKSDSGWSKCQIGLANMNGHFHRSIEHEDRYEQLKAAFPLNIVDVHASLGASLRGDDRLGDEGAANHTRLQGDSGELGHIFVHGGGRGRQSLQAQEAWVKIMNIPRECCLFLEQSEQALKAGVFHNDVIATGFGQHYLYHEKAYCESSREKMRRWFGERPEFQLVEISESEMSLKEAVRSYFFNSQIFQGRDQQWVWLAPLACQTSVRVHALLQRTVERLEMRLEWIEVSQSMMNGGGPACLRLRVPMSLEEYEQCSKRYELNERRYQALVRWVRKYYPVTLQWRDLFDPLWWERSEMAEQELSLILCDHARWDVVI